MKMHTRWFLSGFSGLLFAGLQGLGAAEGIPRAEVIREEALPAVDGMLPDALRAAPPSFQLEELLEGGATPEEATQVWLRTDGEYLYVAVHCSERSGSVRAEIDMADTTAVYADDHLELFLQGGDAHYYHFTTAAGGGYRAQKLADGLRETEGLPNYETATAVGEDGWSAEWRIPLSALWPDVIESAPRMNIARTRQGEEIERSTWVPLAGGSGGRGGFHQPERFGELSGLEGLEMPRKARFRVSAAKVPRPGEMEAGGVRFPLRAVLVNDGNETEDVTPVLLGSYMDGSERRLELASMRIAPGAEGVLETDCLLPREGLSGLEVSANGGGRRVRGLSYLFATPDAWSGDEAGFDFGAFAGGFSEPVGGGTGYSRIVVDGEMRVSDREGFLAALEEVAGLGDEEREGMVITIEPDAVLDFSGWKTPEEVTAFRAIVSIPPGVTVAGNRGVGRAPGPLLRFRFAEEELAEIEGPPHPWQNRVFIEVGSDARLTGVRVEGPDPPSRYGQPIDWSLVPGDNPGHAWANHTVQSRFNGVRLRDNAQVDNCEISNFHYSGLSTAGNTRSRMLCNTIRDVHAYPVLVGNSARADVEGNLIYWSWHAIAGGGTPDSGYVFRNNLVIHDGPASGAHAVDMHAWRSMMRGAQPGAEPPYVDIAGDELLVEYNTFVDLHEAIAEFRELRGRPAEFTSSRDVAVRGVPRKRAVIRRNWFANTLPDEAAILRDNIGGPPGAFSRANFLVEDNVYGAMQFRVPVAMESLPFIEFVAPALEVPREEETRLWSTRLMNPHAKGEPYVVQVAVSPLPDAELSKVRIRLGDLVVYEDVAPPPESGVSVDTTTLPAGPQVVTVEVTDDKGRKARHDSVFNLVE